MDRQRRSWRWRRLRKTKLTDDCKNNTKTTTRVESRVRSQRKKRLNKLFSAIGLPVVYRWKSMDEYKSPWRHCLTTLSSLSFTPLPLPFRLNIRKYIGSQKGRKEGKEEGKEGGWLAPSSSSSSAARPLSCLAPNCVMLAATTKRKTNKSDAQLLKGQKKRSIPNFPCNNLGWADGAGGSS